MRSWIALVAVIAMTTATFAETPWAVGITDNQKAKTQQLLERGNQLFLDKKYGDALEQYRVAIGVWDHPAIRFNMVRCLILLDRPVDASDNLALALKYGRAPLEEGVYNEALGYQKLLANQIGEIAVTCDQPGVKVTLDGHPLLECPGQQHRRVAPGEHQLVGEKRGFLTKTMNVVVLGAKAQTANVALVPLGRAAKVVRRWPQWLPWSVFACGVAVGGLLGGGLNIIASGKMSDFDRQVAAHCGSAACRPNDPSIDASVREGAMLQNRIAIGIMALGGAIALTGGTMLYMNRGRVIYEEAAPPAGAALSVTPTSGGGLVSISGGF
jgi:hypothetical protein